MSIMGFLGHQRFLRGPSHEPLPLLHLIKNNTQAVVVYNTVLFCHHILSLSVSTLEDHIIHCLQALNAAICAKPTPTSTDNQLIAIESLWTIFSTLQDAPGPINTTNYCMPPPPTTATHTTTSSGVNKVPRVATASSVMAIAPRVATAQRVATTPVLTKIMSPSSNDPIAQHTGSQLGAMLASSSHTPLPWTMVPSHTSQPPLPASPKPQPSASTNKFSVLDNNDNDNMEDPTLSAVYLLGTKCMQDLSMLWDYPYVHF